MTSTSNNNRKSQTLSVHSDMACQSTDMLTGLVTKQSKPRVLKCSTGGLDVQNEVRTPKTGDINKDRKETEERTAEEEPAETAELNKSVTPSEEAPLVKEMDILTPGVEAAPAALTDDSALGSEADTDARKDNETLDKEWSKGWCEFVVTVLVNKIFRTSAVYPNPAIITKLKDLLWEKTADCVFPINPSVKFMEKASTKVMKDLHHLSDKMKQQLLLNDEEYFYTTLITILSCILITAGKKHGIKRFFKTTYKKVTKPFTAMFRPNEY